MRTVHLKSQYFKHAGLQILLYKIIIIIETIQIYIFLKIKRIYLEYILQVCHRWFKLMLNFCQPPNTVTSRTREGCARANIPGGGGDVSSAPRDLHINGE